MKKIRLIPRLDIKGPNVVKGVQSEGLRVVGNPRELAFKYYNDGADEIIYMDIVASLYQRNLDFDQLKSVSDNIFIPFTVGGGIRSIGDINNALRAGADKVVINTYAIHHPEFLTEAAKKFGSQCIVLGVDAKRSGDNRWEAYTDGGREKTGVDAIEWLKKAIDLGVGEIMIMSIDQDGTKKGYDLELIKKVTAISPVPVIAHGGAGSFEDILKVINEGGVDAAGAASVYHYGILTISDVKKKLISKKVNVRPV